MAVAGQSSTTRPHATKPLIGVTALDQRPSPESPRRSRHDLFPIRSGRRRQPKTHGEVLVHVLGIDDQLADPLGRRRLDLFRVDLRLRGLQASWWGGWGSNPRPRDYEAIYQGKRGNSRHEWPGQTTLDTGRVPRVSAFRPTASHGLEARARRDRAAALMHRESVALTLSQGGEETQTRVAHKSVSTRSPARCFNRVPRATKVFQNLGGMVRQGPTAVPIPGAPAMRWFLSKGRGLAAPRSMASTSSSLRRRVANRLRVGDEAVLNRSGPPRRRLR